MAQINEYQHIAESWLRKHERPTFSVERFCFGKQKDFVLDKSDFAVACTGRRSGKTVACISDLVSTALSRERVNCLYLTLNRLSAKRIIWPDLIRLNRDYNLGAKVNESDLTLTFPNESVIYISGASDATEIQKYRGMALILCYIDECQSFKSYIEPLIEDVITKCLIDYRGRLRLIGTPGPVPTGYFYNQTQNQNYSQHYWTMFDNPWLPIKSGLTHEQLLQRELTRKGVDVLDPGIQREVFGKWAFDPDALIFKYNEDRNDYRRLPDNGHGFHYVIGVDLGFDDSDALAVLGWHKNSPQLYLVEEIVQNKQGITELAQQLKTLVERYNPDRVVMDTGGLGKKIAEEVTKRFGIHVAAAEKQRKFEYIELLNDALRTKKFMAKKDSRFAQDTKLLEWDRENPSPDRLKVKDTFHSDICDAVLYAFREAYHWAFEPKPEIIKPYTQKWFKQQQDEMWDQAFQRQKEIDDVSNGFEFDDF
jgi:hypothetical protein